MLHMQPICLDLTSLSHNLQVKNTNHKFKVIDVTACGLAILYLICFLLQQNRLSRKISSVDGFMSFTLIILLYLSS